MQAAEPGLTGHRIVGPERIKWTKDCVRRYNTGDSIRTIAQDTRRSYGFVHRILVEGGAAMRGRGGPHTRRKQVNGRP